MLTISIQANTVRLSVDCRLDDIAFWEGTFSWQDPVNTLKAGPGEVMTVENLLFTIVQAYNRKYNLLFFFQQITN